ncbi:inorganic triphosphatase [Magnetospira thiophila]
MTLLKDGQEVELKLALAPEDAARVARAAIVRKHVQGKARTQQLRAIYFDTPDQALRAAGVALRVRREGRQWVQCIKSAGKSQGGLSSRREHETIVPRSTFDLSLLADSDLRDILPMELVGTLAPAFETDIRRTSRRLLLDDGTELDMDMDVGTIIAGDSQTPVSEVELEVVSGDPAQLFVIARHLLHIAPIRLSSQSKAARGYALSSGQGAAWTKSGIPSLDPHMTVEESLTTILHSCTDHLLANEACVLDRSHIEGVHQMRVATRRLRSALSLFKKLLPPEQVAHFNGELKWLINEMGPARDWDVFLDETLPPVAKGMNDDAALAALSRSAGTQRDKAYARANAAILSKRYTDLLIDLGEWIQVRGWQDQKLSPLSAQLFFRVGKIANRLLHKRYRNVLKIGKGFEGLSTEARHEVRIAMKKLRYATEFLSSLYPKDDVGPYVGALKTMQDGLGLMNDISVMRDLLGGLAGSAKGTDATDVALASGAVIGWHEHVFRTHEKDMISAWEAFVKAKPFWPEG